MPKKLVFAVFLALVLITAACQGEQKPRPVPADPAADALPPPHSTCGILPKLVPKCGAWWGVASNPLGSETWDQALINFESKIGRTVNITHYYHRSGQLFPNTSEIDRANQQGKRRILLLNYKPEAGRTWRQVGMGAVDGELDRLAEYMRTHFSQPFFFTVHHEPEDEVRQTAGSGYTAADYRLMYRHVVLRLQQRGVNNLVRVMNYMGLPTWGSQSWFTALYPGNDVVDWIAYDPYIFGSGQYWGGVTDLVNRRFSNYPSWPGFYTWATTFAPGKPLMLGEWGVAERAGSPSAKANVFTGVGQQMSRWPQVKALVYWNSSANHTVGATRVDSSAAALAAYRKAGMLPYFNR